MLGDKDNRFTGAFAGLKGLLLMQKFFIVVFKTSSHYLRVLHKAGDANAVHVTGDGTIQTNVTAPSAAKDWPRSIVLSSLLR